MSEYAYFYNSENGDRVYDADSFSNWLKKFFTTGVFEGDCQVTALGSMVVNLATGYANIMGKVKELENQTFTLEPADGSYPRIDTIVIERNDTDRDITAKLITGELSGNDPIPTPRVWENGVYQLVVAEIYVAAGATEVTQADITDKRSDPDVCGIVAGTVTEMDFSQFTAQFESYFEQFKASNLEEFSEWFEMIKGQLSEDAAGHLQNEIDAINAKIPSGASALNKLATEDEIVTINSNLAGFKFYPAGTGIVGLIADDSPYKDANDKYVIWGTATAEQLVEDNPNTYKSVPSTEDTRGEVGADTATPFKVKYTESNPRINITGSTSNNNGGANNNGSFSCSVNLLPTDKKVKYTCNTPWGETSKYLDGVRTYIGSGNKSETIDLSNNTSFKLGGWGYSTNWSCSWSIKVW